MSNQIKKEFQQKNEPVRLNKYLSEAGVWSSNHRWEKSDYGDEGAAGSGCKGRKKDGFQNR